MDSEVMGNLKKHDYPLSIMDLGEASASKNETGLPSHPHHGTTTYPLGPRLNFQI